MRCPLQHSKRIMLGTFRTIKCHFGVFLNPTPHFIPHLFYLRLMFLGSVRSPLHLKPFGTLTTIKPHLAPVNDRYCASTIILISRCNSSSMDTYIIIDSSFKKNFNYLIIIMAVFFENAWQQQLTRYAKNHPYAKYSAYFCVMFIFSNNNNLLTKHTHTFY